MEFQDKHRIFRGGRDVYADSMAESDDEDETLSLRDLPVYDNAEMSAEWANTLRDSNPESSSSEQEGFDFDFDFGFGRSNSMEYDTCPADDLFHDGRLLPLAESNARFSYSMSNSVDQSRILLIEKLQQWRTDSQDSQSTYWTSSSSNDSQASHRHLNFSASEKGLRHVSSDTANSKSHSAAHRNSSASSKPPSLRPKTSLKWQHFFSLGFIRTPAMKLEDMRFRQQKSSNKVVDTSILKRSVSCSSCEEPGSLKFQQKSRPAKGWIKLATLMSLTSCKTSVNSVINCTTSKKAKANMKPS